MFERLVLANTWAWPLNGDLAVELASRLLCGPVGRELTRRFNLFVNAMIPIGHRLRKLTAAEMAHYGAGHFVQSDAPEEFAAAIHDWRFTPGVPRTREDVRPNTPRE